MSVSTNGESTTRSECSVAPSYRGESRAAVLYMLAPAIITLVVYCRLFHANFAGLDDNIHVYRNPYLVPPTVGGVLHFWRQPYEALYVPLAYTFFALIAHFASIPATFVPEVGAVVNVNAGYFHATNVVLHACNVLLAFVLLRRLVKRDAAAFVGALIFAIHPLQVESVAWVSELRGLLCSFFSLLALIAYIRSRDTGKAYRGWYWYAAALILTILAMLSKPAAVTVPLAALAIDLLALGATWRSSLARIVPWLLISVPFVVITSSAQPVTGAALTAIWQRPFILGDSLTFYLSKVFAPVKLAIIYGRKPQLVMQHWWGYAGMFVVAAVTLICARIRMIRPRIWLGWLLIVIFVLPELGLLPFTYQHFSSVADRYMYLSMLGVGLIAGDLLSAVELRKLGAIGAVVCVPLAVLTVIQTGYWLSTRALMDHDLAVDPVSDAAYNNRGMMELGNKEYSLAIADFNRSIACLPNNDQAMINLGMAYVETKRPAEALIEDQRAFAINPRNPDALSDMGANLIAMGRTAEGLEARRRACVMAPGDPILRYNYAVSLSDVGRISEAIENLRLALASAPAMPQAHVALGVALAKSGQVLDGVREFQIALALDPSNKEAAHDLSLAQGLLAHTISP